MVAASKGHSVSLPVASCIANLRMSHVWRKFFSSSTPKASIKASAGVSADVRRMAGGHLPGEQRPNPSEKGLRLPIRRDTNGGPCPQCPAPSLGLGMRSSSSPELISSAASVSLTSGPYPTPAKHTSGSLGAVKQHGSITLEVLSWPLLEGTAPTAGKAAAGFLDPSHSRSSFSLATWQGRLHPLSAPNCRARCSMVG